MRFIYVESLSNMPNKLKSKKNVNETEVGAVSEELEVPISSDIIFRKMWHIRQFKKTVQKRDTVDSPVFRCAVNNLTTFWNASIRFWKGPKGKKVMNPVVLCLNLTGCETEIVGQARLRFQFGIWDTTIKHWECCPISNVVLNLQNNQELLSVGFKTLGILDRHIDNAKDVCIMIKIQIIHTEEEKHNLSQDMARLMLKESKDYYDSIVDCFQDPETENPPIRFHSVILSARTPLMGLKLQEYRDETCTNIRYKLNLPQYDYNLVKELFRYIYTDKVDNAETYASKLLPLSISFYLPGLTALCERTLLETITPSNVPNILLLADECGCETLRKAALHYCEETDVIKGNTSIGKTLAWRVMEMVNPDLYLEVCESIGSSSSNLDSPSTPGSYSDES